MACGTYLGRDRVMYAGRLSCHLYQQYDQVTGLLKQDICPQAVAKVRVGDAN